VVVSLQVIDWPIDPPPSAIELAGLRGSIEMVITTRLVTEDPEGLLASGDESTALDVTIGESPQLNGARLGEFTIKPAKAGLQNLQLDIIEVEVNGRSVIQALDRIPVAQYKVAANWPYRVKTFATDWDDAVDFLKAIIPVVAIGWGWLVKRKQKES
jgi:hypothetical protein